MTKSTQKVASIENLAMNKVLFQRLLLTNVVH